MVKEGLALCRGYDVLAYSRFGVGACLSVHVLTCNIIEIKYINGGLTIVFEAALTPLTHFLSLLQQQSAVVNCRGECIAKVARFCEVSMTLL
jgi:hypothetical protein